MTPDERVRLVEALAGLAGSFTNHIHCNHGANLCWLDVAAMGLTLAAELREEGEVREEAAVALQEEAMQGYDRPEESPRAAELLALAARLRGQR